MSKLYTVVNTKSHYFGEVIEVLEGPDNVIVDSAGVAWAKDIISGAWFAYHELDEHLEDEIDEYT